MEIVSSAICLLNSIIQQQKISLYILTIQIIHGDEPIHHI